MDGGDPPSVSGAEHKRAFFSYAFTALSFNRISGDYAEFGCHGALTFGLAHDRIARQKPFLGRAPLERHMWAFDSFEGLPERTLATDDHQLWQPGMFAMDVETFHRLCGERGIPRDAYTVVPGFYEQTLRDAAASRPPTDIALAYVDCDMHSSTSDVLEFLRPRLKHGMILAFDDYFCFSSKHASGEKLAFEELRVAAPQWRYERYRDIGWGGTSFIVEGPYDPA
jgi:O-methyltransferase